MEVKIKLQQCAPEIIRITIHATGTIKAFSCTTLHDICHYCLFQHICNCADAKNICLYENGAVQAVSIEFPPHITEWMTLTIPNAFSLIRKVAGLLSYKLPFHT